MKPEQKRFTDEIRRIAAEQELSITEAIVAYCAQKRIDPANVVKLVPDSLKRQIASEAKELNLLKKRKPRKRA